MTRAKSRLKRQMAKRMRELGVDLEAYGGDTLMDCLVNQEAVIITVDTPHGVEWSYGWKNSPWAQVRQWAMAYFDE